ncbi:MAG: hypothetical protein HYU88_02870 [Chloroflexi bacterium]|nr:hypothetical protein [Chloroflexota bacterium]
MARGMRDVLIPDEQDELAETLPRSASRWAVLAAIAGGAVLALGPAAAVVHAADSSGNPGGFGDAVGFDDGSGTGGVALLAPSSMTSGLAKAGSPKTAGSPQKVRNPKRAASGEPQARAENRASAQERAAASRQAEVRHRAQPERQTAAKDSARALSQAKEKEKDRKVGICHATGSDSNPFVFIQVDEHAVDAHQRHQQGRDIIDVSAAAECSAAALVLGLRAQSSQTAESPKTVKTATARSLQSPTGTPMGTATTASPATATATPTATTAGPATIEQQLQQLSQQRQASQDDQAEQSPLVAGVSAEAEAGLDLTPGEAAMLAALLGGGVTAEDVRAMTVEEIAQAAEARGLAPTAVLGAAAAAPTDDQADAPSALPQTGGPGLPLGAALGLGAMLAAAGAVLRRVMQR